MFISKKKLEEKLRQERAVSYERQQEHEQWDRILKLEEQVKKLKKQIKQGY
jgi:hypothetical protein